MERLLHPDDEELARKVARSTFVTRLFVIVAIVLGVACLVVLLQLASSTKTVATRISDKQNSNSPVLTSIEDLAREIRSCTDPAGECAKRGARSQATAIGDINRITLLAAACADRPAQQSVEEIQGCVIRGLTAQQHRTP